MEKTAENTVHVLLTKYDGEDETYVNVFKTKEAVVGYVVGELRRQWEEMHWEEDVEDEDRQDLYDLQDEATKSLNENGWWRDEGSEATYTYLEKEYTA